MQKLRSLAVILSLSPKALFHGVVMMVFILWYC